MSYSKGVINSIILLAATGGLGACGGGGGGGGNSGASDVGISASDPVAITPANAPQVADSTFDATDGLTGNTEGASGFLPAALGEARSAQINVVETIIEQARRAPVLLSSSGAGVAPAATQTSQENCDSGTISGTFNDNDNNLELSTGDTVSMTANNCNFGGVIMNGTVSISNVVMTGDSLSAPYTMQFRMQASSFSVTTTGESVVMSGDGTISETSEDGISITSSFSGNGIEIIAGAETLTLTDYQITETENEATGAYSVSINATISSTSMGGSVSVTTDVALTGVGSADPDAGQLTCTGADNSELTLVVVDSLNVEIQVDADGIDGPEETLSLAWTEL